MSSPATIFVFLAIVHAFYKSNSYVARGVRFTGQKSTIARARSSVAAGKASWEVWGRRCLENFAYLIGPRSAPGQPAVKSLCRLAF